MGRWYGWWGGALPCCNVCPNVDSNVSLCNGVGMHYTYVMPIATLLIALQGGNSCNVAMATPPLHALQLRAIVISIVTHAENSAQESGSGHRQRSAEKV